MLRMGFAPPENQPSPSEQDAVEAEASFEPSPSGPSLCGFGFPMFSFDLNLKIPSLPLPSLPNFDFMIQLNCDLANPIDADFAFGGGRVGRVDPDSDDTVKQS